ncbi:hypothetical protein OXX79_012229, partial [Metschnikowia pulcherrima]
MKPTVSTSSKDSDGQSSEMDISPYIQDRKTTLQSLKDAVLLKSLFEKIEDRPTPSSVYNWRIYFTALISSAAAIIIGYDGGFIG